MTSSDANELSVRPQGADDNIYTTKVYVVDPRLTPTLARAKRVVILIHGFNTGVTDARKAFAKFRERLRDGDRFDADEVWEFHWPGDDPNPVISRASYFGKVGSAIAIGERLGRYIASDELIDKDVILVAHSLGCRIALEALAQVAHDLPANRRSPVSETFLLAAAVPYKRCEPRALFPAPLPGSREHAFFSPDDSVLGRYFEIGQRFAGPAEASEAVGLRGRPGSARWFEPWNTWLEHGQYWSARLVSDEVLRRLGYAVPQPLPRRPLNPARLASRAVTKTVLTGRRLRRRRL